MADLLEKFAELWPDFWWLIIAAPIYGVWIKFLSGPTWTSRIRSWLANDAWSGAYAEMLNFLDKKLSIFFGRNWINIRSIKTCTIIAISYSLIWSIFVSILSSEDKNTQIFLAIVMFSILNCFAVYFISVNNEKVFISFSDLKNSIKTKNPEQISYHIIDYMMTCFAIIAVFALLPSIVFIFGSKSLIVTHRFQDLSINILFLASFIVFVNIYFDMISLIASRFLISRLYFHATKPNSILKILAIFVHIITDIVLALLSLIGLSFFISVVFYDTVLWKAAYHDPFSITGSTLTLMIMSTLLPTFLHLFCALFSILPALPFGQRSIVDFIPSKHSFDTFEAGDKIIVATWLMIWSVVSIVMIWWIFKFGAWALDIIVLQRDWLDDGKERNFWQLMLDAGHSITVWMKFDQSQSDGLSTLHLTPHNTPQSPSAR